MRAASNVPLAAFSSHPEGGPRQINYSFRAMAQDQVDVMEHFGFARFYVAGHDRGAGTACATAGPRSSGLRKKALPNGHRPDAHDALMLEHLGEHDAAGAIIKAIEKVPASGPKTRDMGGSASTEEVGKAIAATF